MLAFAPPPPPASPCPHTDGKAHKPLLTRCKTPRRASHHTAGRPRVFEESHQFERLSQSKEMVRQLRRQ